MDKKSCPSITNQPILLGTRSLLNLQVLHLHHVLAAEVYAPLGGVDQVDYTKRGGRYTSDFIWNTKWKDQVLTVAGAIYDKRPW